MLRKTLLFAAVAVALGGCSSITLEPHGHPVIVSSNKPAKGCKYVGQVIGNQGNFFTGPWTSNRNLEQGAINDMKNQAGKLGANYIQIFNSRAGNTGSFHGNYGGSMEQTNVTYTGNAYSCPEL